MAAAPSTTSKILSSSDAGNARQQKVIAATASTAARAIIGASTPVPPPRLARVVGLQSHYFISKIGRSSSSSDRTVRLEEEEESTHNATTSEKENDDVDDDELLLHQVQEGREQHVASPRRRQKGSGFCLFSAKTKCKPLKTTLENGGKCPTTTPTTTRRIHNIKMTDTNNSTRSSQRTKTTNTKNKNKYTLQQRDLRVRFNHDLDVEHPVPALPPLTESEFYQAFWSKAELHALYVQARKESQRALSQDSSLASNLLFAYHHDHRQQQQHQRQEEPGNRTQTPEAAIKYVYFHEIRQQEDEEEQNNSGNANDQVQPPQQEEGATNNKKTTPERLSYFATSTSTLRGLERYIAPELLDTRKETIQAVLALQRTFSASRRPPQRTDDKNDDNHGGVGSRRRIKNPSLSGTTLPPLFALAGNNHPQDKISALDLFSPDEQAKLLRRVSTEGSTSARRFARFLGKGDAAVASACYHQVNALHPEQH
ncbi:hypothetical protein ACA910_007299 [Epithemia clementina (nom. ined.)]